MMTNTVFASAFRCQSNAFKTKNQTDAVEMTKYTFWQMFSLDVTIFFPLYNNKNLRVWIKYQCSATHLKRNETNHLSSSSSLTWFIVVSKLIFWFSVLFVFIWFFACSFLEMCHNKHMGNETSIEQTVFDSSVSDMLSWCAKQHFRWVHPLNDKQWISIHMYKRVLVCATTAVSVCVSE